MAEQSTIAVYPLDGTNRKFVVPYEYLARRFVTVTLLGTDRKPLVLGTDFRFITANQIETTQAWGDTQGYANIEVRRVTSAAQRLVDFYDGSVLRSRDLNVSAIQTIHIAEEARNLATYTLSTDDDGNLDARGRRLVNLGDAVNPKDALTLGQVMGWSQSALNQANRSQAEADKSAASAQAAAQSAAQSDAYSLRQDLANPDMGAAMMARGVVAVDSIADLLALSEGQRKEGLRYLVKGYYAGSEVGGGEFIWSQAATESTDGFSVINPYATEDVGRFIRIIRGDVTPEMAGAIGDGVVDDGPSLRAVSNYLNKVGGGVISMRPNAIYSASVENVGTPRPSVMRHIKNIHLRMNGAVVQANSTVRTFNYNIIDYMNSKSCSLSGGTLRGNKYNPEASSGSFGMGIGLYGASNIDIDDMKIIEQGGDGIYIGRIGSDQSFCENITISNTVCDDNRRQGISLISCRNLYAKNLHLTNTNGAAPQDGIDIEPNNPDEELVNIVFENLVTEGNAGAGVKFFLANLTESSTPMSITFRGFKDTGSTYGCRYRFNRCRGFVKFEGLTELSNNVHGFHAEASENALWEFERLVISESTRRPLYVGTGSDPTNTGMENLRIHDMTIEKNGPLVERPAYMDTRNHPFTRNITIGVRSIDVGTVSNTELGMIIGTEARGVRIETVGEGVGVVGEWSDAGATLRTFSHYRFKARTRYVGTGSDLFSIVGGIPRGCYAEFESAFARHPIKLNSSGDSTIYPAGAGKTLYLIGRGAWVRIYRDPVEPAVYRVTDGAGYEWVDNT